MDTQRVTWRHFFSIMLSIAFPIAMQNLLSTTAGMVDTIMIGGQGELAVAAVGICSQISSLFFSCYWGFASGAILFFAQFWGAKDKDGINRTFGITFLCMAVVAALFSAAAISNPEWILSVYTDKEHIIALGAPYIRIVGFAYPLQVLAVLFSFFLRATERVKLPLYSSIIALAVNFVLNFLLINGYYGFPKMGVAGAAVGTLVSGIVNLAILAVYTMTAKCEIRLQISLMFRIEPRFLKGYLVKSLPILCNELFYGVGQMIINIVIGHQDESAIAAMAAFRVCEGFVYAFFGGLSNAASVVIGKEIGGGNPMRAFSYMKKSTFFCPLVTFCIVLTCVLLSHPLLSLFGLGETALTYGRYMLLIYLMFGTIRTCNYIMNESYRAAGETVFGTVLEISCLFLISVPATWVAGMVLHLPFLAVFAFVYTDEIVRLIAELRYTATGKWIKPVTELGRAALPAFREQLHAGKKARRQANG